MSGFQYLVSALLVVLVYLTLRSAVRGAIRRRIAAFWLLVWIGAGVAALWPQGTLLAARVLGIGRGADLVMYCSVLAMLAGFFYIYTRFRRLDRAFTLLVRRLAIENPQLPPGTSEPQAGAGAPRAEAPARPKG
jgi:hypothetical protein